MCEGHSSSIEGRFWINQNACSCSILTCQAQTLIAGVVLICGQACRIKCRVARGVKRKEVSASSTLEELQTCQRPMNPHVFMCRH